MVSQLSLASLLCDVRKCWKELALTDIVYKVVAFAVLTPLVGFLFRFLIGISGRQVLADEDILFLLVRPLGWAAFIIVGGVAVAIVALELAALMAIVCTTGDGRGIGVLGALRFTASRARPLLHLTARMVGWTFLIAAPFLAACGGVYLALLTEHDINHYLAEKPPEFWTAAGLAGVILLALLIVLLRVLLGWAVALQLLLFEGTAVSKALRTSRERMVGHRTRFARWVVAWALASTVLSAVGAGAVGLLGRAVVPHATGSLTLLAVSVGGMLLLWGAVNFAVSLLSTAVLAILLARLYEQLGGQDALAAFAAAAEREQADATPWLTRKKLVAALVVAAVVAGAVGAVVLRGVRFEDATEITAHRGASSVAPENTIAAIQQAIAEGADWVEIDVQESADGTVVVIHDSDLKRVAGADLKIWDATDAKLGEFDIGSWFDPRFSGERIPTLVQVLETCKKGKAGLNIELKPYGHGRRLEERVAEAVEACGMASKVVVMSLKHDAAARMKELRPEWTVGLLTAKALGDVTKLEADFFAVSASLATRSFIRDAHRRGKKVYVWTVNDPVLMSIMMGRGADNIITDKPALARSVRAQRRRMGSAERLLVNLAILFGVTPKVSTSLDEI